MQPHDQRTAVLLALILLGPVLLAQDRGFRPLDASKIDSLSVKPGKDYALLIGIDAYEELKTLANPVRDARTISEELRDQYGFQTEILENVRQREILLKLRDYALRKYGEQDQLFIFFAGHGQFDDVTGDGYLAARDSKLKDDAKMSYISHSSLRTSINNIPCRHILLVVDACFGGTFDPLIAANLQRGEESSDIAKPEFIARKMKFKTRKYITSGGKEYVPDVSPFVRRLLEAFRSYGGSDGILTFNELLPFLDKVRPEPRHGDFGSPDPGSDFLFVAKAPPKYLGTMTILPSPPDAKVFIDGKHVSTGSLERFELPPGKHDVMVVKESFDEWQKEVNVDQGKDTQIEMKLDITKGYVSVVGVPSDAEVLIDGKKIGLGPLVRHDALPGSHALEVRTSDPALGASREVVIVNRRESKLEVRLGQFNPYPALRSAVIPGLGQIINGSIAKGFMFLGGTLGAGAYVVLTHLDYTDQVGKYNSLVTAYASAASVDEATTKRGEMLRQFTVVEDAKKMRLIAAGATAGLYLLNLLDALLFDAKQSQLVLLSDQSEIQMRPMFYSAAQGPALEVRIVIR
ncbi:MAG: caspase family protein [Ignavibacteriales bacterium]|nr:caspase family protein [Ignavibacteriales bacterium]